MNKLKRFLFNIFNIIMILFIVITITKLMFKIFDTTVSADVGSFQDYGSGGSSSHSNIGHSSGFSMGTFGIMVLTLLVVLILSYILATIFERQDKKHDAEIEKKVKSNDKNFNKEEFIKWSNNLFIKLQQAWAEGNWETIRIFETESLFEQHKNQLQGYINNNQINVMEEIEILSTYLKDYKIDGDKEILTLSITSKMKDYIIDATTKQLLKGNKQGKYISTYLLTFIRKKRS